MPSISTREQADVFVGVAREQYHVGRLKIFLAAFDVNDTGHALPCRHTPRWYDRPRHDLKTLGLYCLGNSATAVEFLAVTWQPPRLQKP